MTPPLEVGTILDHAYRVICHQETPDQTYYPEDNHSQTEGQNQHPS